MTLTTPSPMLVDPAVVAATDKIAGALATPAVQALDTAIVAAVVPKIPAKVRSGIYEGLKWVGLLGSAATATAGFLTGQAALYVGTGGFALLAVSNLLSKAHVTGP